MKLKRILAAVLIVALCVSLAGCYNPKTVGKVGKYEIPAGIYLMCQLNAFSEAVTTAQAEAEAAVEGTEDEPADINARNILDHEVDGVPAREWIESRTEELLRNFGFIELEYEKLGLSMSSWDEYYVEYMASESWSSNGASYQKNGIGYETFLAATANNYKSGALFDATYMADDAPKKISDDEYIAEFENLFVRFDALRFPTMKISGDDFTDTEHARLEQIAQQMVDDINGGMSAEQAFIANYGEVLTLQESSTSADADHFAELYKTDVLTYPGDSQESYTADFIEAVHAAEQGQAATYISPEGYILIFYSYPVLEAGVEEDGSEEEGAEWEDYKSVLASSLKEDEFNDYIEQNAAELEFEWDNRAKKYYSVDKIKL